MRAADKRVLAEIAIECARKGKSKEASRVRQQAYAKDPPGSIDIDWSDWAAIWAKDNRYLSYLNAEKFSDLKNSKRYIESLKASIFVDYLFGFRDAWGVECHREFCQESICCPLLDKFLRKMDLEEETRDIVYMTTVKQNIETKIYIDSAKKMGLNTTKHPHMTYIYKNGEYYIGIPKGTPEDQVRRVLDGRRKFLNDYALFEQCSVCGIEKFPKTFQTFQKHKKENSEKYQLWMQQYRAKGG